MAEKVSVIIPTYNRAPKLLNSVNSVLQQTYTNMEVLIVDDGSTDNTQEVVEAIVDTRVRYIKLPHNMGASGARNAGVEYAETDIIAFQDSDDLWIPDKLEKQMKYWKEHPEFSMIYCAICLHDSDGMSVFPGEGFVGDLEGDILSWLLFRNSIGTPTMLMYKNCFIKAGGFDVTMNSLEDWDFAIRFAKKYLIGYLDKPLVDSYDTAGGISSRVGAYYESRCKMIANYKEDLLACGIFDSAVNDLFQRAQNRNMLETVKKMLLLFLSQK